MKNLKKIIFGCSCILFLSVSNVVFAATGKVTGKTVRIRESADASSKIVTNAYRNDTVEVLSTEGDWYKVKYEDKTGYMSKEFLEVKDEVKEEVKEEVSASTTSENNTQQSNQTNLNTEEKNKIVKETNLKLLPNFSSTNLGLVSVDTEIKIEKEINNWLQITAGSNTGWVLKNYVSANQVSNSEVPEPENNQPETAQPDVVEPEATTPETTPTNTEPEAPEPEVKTENEPENKEEPKEQGTTNKIAYISTDTARVRATAGGKILGNLDLNDEITIIGEDGEWYKITCSEYSEGYVSKKLVSTERVSSRSSNGTRTPENAEQTAQVDNTTPEPTPEPAQAPASEPTPTPAPTPELAPAPEPAPSTSNKGEEIVAYAKSFLGCRYISGGTSPNGFDCSGFTQYVYSHFGYSIARVASAQNSNGTAVARSNLQPGDIVVFLDYGKSKIGHVGIYIGNGNFVHAANPSRGVVIDNLNSNSYYNQRYVSARRIV
ncbi:MAG: SH3 domain-containing protein [Clostridia bacterium]|nr:SH3 domain-containing protein [Clostridia bacterium]